jgi:hypothetical protein
LHRLNGRLERLEDQMRVTPAEELLAGLSDMEVTALLALLEAIGALPDPQQAEAQRLMTGGLQRRAKGTPWHAAMKTAHTYIVTATEARP